MSYWYSLWSVLNGMAWCQKKSVNMQGMRRYQTYFLFTYARGNPFFLHLILALRNHTIMKGNLFLVTPLVCYTDSAVHNGDGTGSAVHGCCWNNCWTRYGRSYTLQWELWFKQNMIIPPQPRHWLSHYSIILTVFHVLCPPNPSGSQPVSNATWNVTMQGAVWIQVHILHFIMSLNTIVGTASCQG